MIEQIGIALFGVTGIVLANVHREGARKWAPVFGMIGQIFWFWSSLASKQWGIFFMCFVYTGAWGLGIYNHWFAKKKPKVGI